MAEELLFGFPPDEKANGVRFYLENANVSNTNVIEIFYRLDVQYDGQVESFRLPHDLEQLWYRLQSTAIDTSTSGPARRLPSTSPRWGTDSTSLPVTPTDPSSA